MPSVTANANEAIAVVSEQGLGLPTGAVEPCSFCGKSESEVRAFVSGPAWISICDECVALAADLIARKLGPDWLAGMRSA